ncbi:MAG: hypothetical protein VYB72_02730, partial [Planctomycetota bacterium]|nr:hypothetical protein [Planctomycetota bacterium]
MLTTVQQTGSRRRLFAKTASPPKAKVHKLSPTRVESYQTLTESELSGLKTQRTQNSADSKLSEPTT